MRRIVGVTRGQAHAAVERAKAFEQQLDAADVVEDLSLDTLVNNAAVRKGFDRFRTMNTHPTRSFCIETPKCNNGCVLL